MPNARIQSKVANAGLRNTTPAARPSFAQSVHSRAVSPSLHSRITVPNVDTITSVTTTSGGSPIGLLLALTYSTITQTITVVKGGYGPHARIR